MTAPIPKPEDLLRHRAFLHALARSMLGDTHRAEDAVQEALVAAIEKPPADSGNLRGWLTGVVKNVVRMTKRGEGRRSRRERAAARPEASTSPEEAVARVEAGRRLTEAVLALPEPGRSALVLCYHEGLTVAEAARRLDVPEKTLYSRLARAKARLREELAEDGNWRTPLFAFLPALSQTGKAATVATLATGGIVVSTTQKVVGVVVVLVLLGTAAYFRSNPSGKNPPGNEPDAVPPALAGLATGTGEGPPAPERDDVTPVAPDGRRLLVTVTNQSGSPLSGAVIRFFDPTGTQQTQAKTGEEGTARLDLPGEGSLAVIRVGFAPALVESLNLDPGEETELPVVLTPGLSISGVVLDQEGNRCERATRVTVAAEPLDLDPRFEGTRIRPANSGPGGRFEIRNLPPGDYRLRVTPRRGRVGSPPKEEIVVPAGTRDLTIRLGPTGAVVLVLIDDATGEPVTAAVSYAFVGTETMVHVSGAAGRLIVEELPADKVTLQVKVDGYLTVEDVAIEASRGLPMNEYELRLKSADDAGSRIVLLVEDEGGTPVEEVDLTTVRVMGNPLNENTASNRKTVTGKGGRYVFPVAAGVWEFHLRQEEGAKEVVCLAIEVVAGQGVTRRVTFGETGSFRLKFPPGDSVHRHIYYGGTAHYHPVRKGNLYSGVPPGTVKVVAEIGGKPRERTFEVRVGELIEVDFEE